MDQEKLTEEFSMKTMRQVLSVLSVVFGVLWLRGPAAAQTLTCGWSEPGGGVSGFAPAVWALATSEEPSGVAALTVFNDGTGAALYAGGYFTTAGGVEANRITKWDGT